MSESIRIYVTCTEDRKRAPLPVPLVKHLWAITGKKPPAEGALECTYRYEFTVNSFAEVTNIKISADSTALTACTFDRRDTNEDT